MAWTERYVRADADGSGNGTTDTNSGTNGAWTLAQLAAITDSSLQGVRINIKAGTYDNTTTTRTFAPTTLLTAPTWYRGYKTTPGDQAGNYDAVPGTDIPLFTFTSTARMYFNASYLILSDFAVSGPTTGSNGLLHTNGGLLIASNISVENTGSGATSYAIVVQSSPSLYVGCKFTKTQATCQVVNNGAAAKYVGCYVSGGTSGIQGTTQGANCFGCVIAGSTGSGIASTTASITAQFCTFRNHSENGILSTSGTPNHFVFCNYFESCSTAAVNNTSGSNLLGQFVGNVTRSCGARFLGFGDTPEFFAGPDLSDTGLVDPDNGNYLPNDLLQDEGFPKRIPGLTGTATPSAGALQLYNLGGGGAAFSRIFSGF